MIPARPLQRYAAWSIDAACVCLLAALACHRLFAPAIGRLSQAGDAMLARLSQLLVDSVSSGAGAFDLLLLSLGDAALRASIAEFSAALLVLAGVPLLVAVLLGLAWHIGFERSRWQATPGKRLLGLRVQTVDGGRPTLGATVLRQVLGLLSWGLLNLGHAPAAFAPHYRAVHDLAAGTGVFARDARVPGWVVAWLLLQLVALVAAMAWWDRAVDAALQAAFSRLL